MNWWWWGHRLFVTSTPLAFPVGSIYSDSEGRRFRITKHNYLGVTRFQNGTAVHNVVVYGKVAEL